MAPFHLSEIKAYVRVTGNLPLKVITLIMAREAKFNFIPEGQLRMKSADTEYRVNINTNSMLYFPREVVEVWDLDKKFFKFFADTEKRTIGWSTFDQGTLVDLEKSRKLTISKTGVGVISIQKCLTAIGLLEIKEPIRGLLVKTYNSSYLHGEVQYITIDKKSPFKNEAEEDLEREAVKQMKDLKYA